MLVFMVTSLVLGQAQTEILPPTEVDQTFIEQAPTTQDPDNTTPAAKSAPDLNLGAPSIEPPPGTPSFLLANVAVSQSTQWYPNGGYTSARILGNVELLKVWHHSVTSFDYVGGESYSPAQQIQHFTAAHAFLWRGRQLTIADSFGSSNTGGNFGASLFGGGDLFGLIFAGTGASLPGGLSSFSGGTNFGGFGSQITNVTQATYTQSLTPRSSFTLLGSYGISTYDGSTPNLNNSRQLSTAVQYGYQINARSTIGFLYGYRTFNYPLSTQGDLKSNIMQLFYRRVVSERLNVAVGAGPEFDNITSTIAIPIFSPPLVIKIQTKRLNLSVHGSLEYNLKKSSLRLSYQRLSTNGSGLFTGSNSDVAQATLNRRIFRAWRASFNSGYVRLNQIQQSATANLNSYQYWFTGVGIRRSLGEHLNFIASYQLHNETSINSGCVAATGCGGRRSTMLIGLSWHSRPIRLDRGREWMESPGNTNATEDDQSNINNPPLPQPWGGNR